MEGWVKIHRQICENPLWTAEKFSKGQAWTDLFLLANHKKGFIMVRGIKIDVERGQVGWSEIGLSQRWKWSRTKVKNFLKMLEKEQQIKQQKDNVSLIISIVNYDKYQSEEQQKEHKKSSRRAAEEQQKDTNKNVKNEKNVSKGKFKKPSIDEINEYCSERNNNVDGNKFFNFYESKGWMVGKNKMRNWKAAVITWESKSKNTNDDWTSAL